MLSKEVMCLIPWMFQTVRESLEESDDASTSLIKLATLMVRQIPAEEWSKDRFHREAKKSVEGTILELIASRGEKPLIAMKCAVKSFAKLSKRKIGGVLQDWFGRKYPDEFPKMSRQRLAHAFAMVRIVLKEEPTAFAGEPFLASALKKAFSVAKCKYGKSPSEELGCKVEAMKLMGAELLRRASGVNVQDGSIETPMLLLLLRRIVADLGNPWGMEEKRALNNTQMWPPSGKAEHTTLRLCAASQLLKLLGSADGSFLSEGSTSQERLKRSVQRWVELSRLAIDPTSQVLRERFAHKVYNHVLKKSRGGHFRFGVFLALVAGTAGEIGVAPQSQRWLVQLLQSLSKASARTKSARLSPECMIPNLVYLLSKHPSLPGNLEDLQISIKSTSGQRMLTRPLVFFLKTLESVNAGFLHAHLNAIHRHSDVLLDGADDPAYNHVHVICEIARKLLETRFKYSPESLSNYPGQIFLPRCFAARVDEENVNANQSPGFGISPIKPVNRETLLPQDFQVKPVLGSGKKSKGTKSKSSSKTPSGKKRKHAAEEAKQPLRRSSRKSPKFDAKAVGMVDSSVIDEVVF